jgi:Family of unknown function (DUF6188)
MYRPLWSGAILAELEYTETQKLIDRREQPNVAAMRARHRGTRRGPHCTPCQFAEEVIFMVWQRGDRTAILPKSGPPLGDRPLPVAVSAFRVHSENMSDRKFIEHWLQYCVLDRISFRDGLVLDFGDHNELVISAPLRLTLPATDTLPDEVVTIDPYDVPPLERPIFDFAGSTCTSVVLDDDGDLHVKFSSGNQIDVSPDERVTAWELYGEYHGYAACLPHGELQYVQLDRATVELMRKRLARGQQSARA